MIKSYTYEKNCEKIRTIMNNIYIGAYVLYKKSLRSEDVFLGKITYIEKCDLYYNHCRKDLKCKGKIGIDENIPCCVCSSLNSKTPCLITSIVYEFIDEGEFKI